VDEPERPTVGLLPKLLVGALALFGLLTLLSWVLSWFFGLARLLLLVAVVVIVVLWLTGRFGRGRDDGHDAP
jgi:hypothetical protein